MLAIIHYYPYEMADFAGSDLSEMEKLNKVVNSKKVYIIQFEENQVSNTCFTFIDFQLYEFLKGSETLSKVDDDLLLGLPFVQDLNLNEGILKVSKYHYTGRLNLVQFLK